MTFTTTNLVEPFISAFCTGFTLEGTEMADSGRVKHDSPSSSPGPGRKKAQQSPGSKARYSVNAPGHCFRRVTLTKPTFCHHCSDFIWGIVGFVCEGRLLYGFTCSGYYIQQSSVNKASLNSLVLNLHRKGGTEAPLKWYLGVFTDCYNAAQR